MSCLRSPAGILAIALFLLPAPSGAAERQTAAAAVAQVPAIVISGRYAGPKLWRVSKDESHVLWVLGTVAPLPKRMVWQTADLQRLLRHTQEVIPAWPSVGIGFHPFTALHLYALWREAQTNPDHLPLQAAQAALRPARPADRAAAAHSGCATALRAGVVRLRPHPPQ
jgi:hypothetical protein